MSMRVENWGFATSPSGELLIGGVAAEEVARQYGTPVHVIDELGLRTRAQHFRCAFQEAYPHPFSAYYALKCNNTPAIVRMILEEGFSPEVGTLYEWMLAIKLGVSPIEVMVNGPNKGPLLEAAVSEGAGLIVIDSFEELYRAEKIAGEKDRQARILLRLNPNYIPKGMNRASATGSRKRSVFGFDLATGEVERALLEVSRMSRLHFLGLHCHVGTGIRKPEDYHYPLKRLVQCAAEARRLGLRVEVINIGGGFGVPTSRELNTGEFLLYQAGGRLPRAPDADSFPPIGAFAAAAGETIEGNCRKHGLPLPRLVVEPGRAIASGAGVLLITVGSLKEREGVGTWAITDGGAGTVAFPLFYEYHEIFLCRAPGARRTRRYTIVGPVCFSADWIYHNKTMPPLRSGDVLAVCDAGAYFTVQESNFGFPRPAIVAVSEGTIRLLRRRETFEDMVSRDVNWGNGNGY